MLNRAGHTRLIGEARVNRERHNAVRPTEAVARDDEAFGGWLCRTCHWLELFRRAEQDVTFEDRLTVDDFEIHEDGRTVEAGNEPAVYFAGARASDFFR